MLTSMTVTHMALFVAIAMKFLFAETSMKVFPLGKGYWRFKNYIKSQITQKINIGPVVSIGEKA